MAFTRTTEVRHISPAELGKVAQLLNQTFAWTKLMQTVPFELTHPEQLNEGKRKYDIHHIKLIQNASFKYNRPPAQIFLEEWVTSGRIRPTLGHLLQLLIKSELFRAADYVAVNLLSEAPPQRPSKGPAAKIDIELPPQNDSIGEQISGMKYPNSSDILNLNHDQTQNKDIHSKQIFDRILSSDAPRSEVDLIRLSTSSGSSVNNAPIRITNNTSTPPYPSSSEVIEVSPRPTNNIPLAQHPSNILTGASQRLNESGSQISLPQGVANFANFSNTSRIGMNSTHSHQLHNQPKESTHNLTSTSSITSVDDLLPQISILNINSFSQPVQQLQSSKNDLSSTMASNILPSVSLLNLQGHSDDSNSYEHQTNTVELPNLSGLNLNSASDTHATDEQEFSPNLSGLNINGDSDPHAMDEQELSGNIPQLSALLQL